MRVPTEAEKELMRRDNQVVNCWGAGSAVLLVLGILQMSKGVTRMDTVDWIFFGFCVVVCIIGVIEVTRRTRRMRRFYGVK